MLKRFFIFLIISLIIITSLFFFFETTKNYLFLISLFFLLLLFYIGGEMIWTFIKNGNYFIISGLVIMVLTIITYTLGYWEEGLINKAFIVAVAILAMFFSIKDFIEIGSFSDNAKKTIGAFLFLCTISLICSILMISSNVVKLDNMNTDYLAFISLGIAFSNIGLRQHKQKILENNQ